MIIHTSIYILIQLLLIVSVSISYRGPIVSSVSDQQIYFLDLITLPSAPKNGRSVLAFKSKLFCILRVDPQIKYLRLFSCLNIIDTVPSIIYRLGNQWGVQQNKRNATKEMPQKLLLPQKSYDTSHRLNNTHMFFCFVSFFFHMASQSSKNVPMLHFGIITKNVLL